jgi:VIT1/CCC1 family predicted Fe2+/Mn2+ transporter
MSMHESWQEEKQSAWLYEQLSRSEPDPKIAQLFKQLGEEAQAQAQHWSNLLHAQGQTVGTFSPTKRARLVAALARRLTPRWVQPALIALKVRGVSAYQNSKPTGHPMPTHITDVGRGHRNVGGGNLRAAIFGINDGLVSNASLIMGMVGALGTQAQSQSVLTAGIAGLLAGALSMATGEFVSVRSQRELFEYQIALEKEELAEYPEAEAEELALIYAARGLSIEEARTLANKLIADPVHALDVLAREELGLNPNDLGSPWGAAFFSFISFTVGAVIPLLPFLITQQLKQIAPAAALLAALALFGTGAAMSLFTGRNAWFGGFRMLLIGGGAGVITFFLGQLFGGVFG